MRSKWNLRFNIILLAASALVTGSLVTLYLDNGVGEEIGEIAKRAYQRHYNMNSKSAEKQIRTDAKWPVALIDEWSHVQHLDRAYQFKRRLYLTGAQSLREAGRHADLLTWAQNWAGDDPRDVSARAHVMEARYRLAPQRPGSNKELAVLWTKFSRNRFASRFFADSLVDSRDFARLDELNAQQRAHNLARPLANSWQVFWGSGSGYSETNSIKRKLARDGDLWILDVTVPPGTKAIRVDPPEYSSINIQHLQFGSHHGILAPKLNNDALYNMMVNGDQLVALGKADPYFTYEVSNLVGADATTVRVQFRLEGAIDANFQAAHVRATELRGRQ